MRSARPPMIAAVLALAALAWPAAPQARDTRAIPPTFSRNVAAIFNGHCVSAAQRRLQARGRGAERQPDRDAGALRQFRREQKQSRPSQRIVFGPEIMNGYFDYAVDNQRLHGTKAIAIAPPGR